MGQDQHAGDAASLWRALGAALQAHAEAISAGDVERGEVALAEQERLMGTLRLRDAADDVARDPAVLALARAAEEGEQAAEAALRAAQAEVAEKLAGLGARRAAQTAFVRARGVPGSPAPRFFDGQG